MLKDEVKKYEEKVEELIDKDEVVYDNSVSVVDISYILIENNEETDLNNIIKLSNMILTEDKKEYLDEDIDCDDLTNIFEICFNKDRQKVLDLLENDVDKLYQYLMSNIDLIYNEED